MGVWCCCAGPVEDEIDTLLPKRNGGSSEPAAV